MNNKYVDTTTDLMLYKRESKETNIHLVKKTENLRGWGPRGVMVKAMAWGIVGSEFVFQLRSLSAKYPWERHEPPYPPSYGLNSTTTVLLGE